MAMVPGDDEAMNASASSILVSMPSAAESIRLSFILATSCGLYSAFNWSKPVLIAAPMRGEASHSTGSK